jgi:uncharacterized membrane protein YqaE (UPF0057 family)|tara:strand:+ start:211 stop:522 length:312 start_codon:yes stop_codon:yes gene_type:complete
MAKDDRIARRARIKARSREKKADRRDERRQRNPGCDSFKKICYPKTLFDTIIAVLFPPLYVIIHEYRKTPKFKDMSNIIQNIILTSMFYVPGLMHAMFLLNND